MTPKKSEGAKITWTGEVDLSAPEDRVEEQYQIVMQATEVFARKFDDLMTEISLRGLTTGTIRIRLEAVLEDPSSKSPNTPRKKKRG